MKMTFSKENYKITSTRGEMPLLGETYKVVRAIINPSMLITIVVLVEKIIVEIMI
jgi:hypothetical protein